MPSNLDSFETNSHENRPRLLPVFLKSVDWFCTWRKPCGVLSPTCNLLHCIPLWEFSPSCFCLSPSSMHLFTRVFCTPCSVAGMFSVWLTVFSFFFFHLLQPMWVSYLFSQPGKILHLVLKFSRYSQRSVKNLPWRAESGMYWNILGVERCLKIPGLLIGPLWDLGFIALTWDSVWLCGLVLLFIIS